MRGMAFGVLAWGPSHTRLLTFNPRPSIHPRLTLNRRPVVR